MAVPLQEGAGGALVCVLGGDRIGYFWSLMVSSFHAGLKQHFSWFQFFRVIDVTIGYVLERVVHVAQFCVEK